MKHKVSELQGATLDAAVGMALGVKPRLELVAVTFGDDSPPRFAERHLGYSTNWAAGGPIIELEMISIRWGSAKAEGGFATLPRQMDDCQDHTGHTALIAAMRAFVTSKLGETVDLP